MSFPVSRLAWILGRGVAGRPLHDPSDDRRGGLVGTWFDRTREYNAKLRRKELAQGSPRADRPSGWATPLLAALGRGGLSRRVQEMVREINESAAAARAESLIPSLGPDGVTLWVPSAGCNQIGKCFSFSGHLGIGGAEAASTSVSWHRVHLHRV